jgi:hypothetical protein
MNIIGEDRVQVSAVVTATECVPFAVGYRNQSSPGKRSDFTFVSEAFCCVFFNGLVSGNFLRRLIDFF